MQMQDGAVSTLTADVLLYSCCILYEVLHAFFAQLEMSYLLYAILFRQAQ